MKWFIDADDRQRHVYLSGKSRSGKSTLMHAMALQDIKNGHGVCFIDAKGDLVPQLIHWIPRSRRDDCIWLDLAVPIPIDFMSCESHDEAMDLVSDIIQIFNRMEDGLGIRMDAIVRFTVTSLLRMGGATFIDIYTAMTDESFRERIRNHPKVKADPILSNFWNTQAEKIIKGESGVGIAISRMTRFILSPAFRTILGTPNAPLNIARAIEERKIILVKLKPASDEAMLYGSLIVSKIQQAIFRRNNSNKSKLVPFMLYVDEFQQFKSSGFEEILSMGGGLGLYLTLANQYFAQLNDTNLEDAIINNVSTFLLFRMNPTNAGKLAGELKEDDPPPKPDIKAMKKRIKFLKDQEEFLENRSTFCAQKGWDSQKPIEQWVPVWTERVALEKELEEAEKPQPPPVTFLSQLPYLEVGQAVYRAADGETSIIRTPPPPPHTSAVGKTSHATHIISHTIYEYGQILPKRPVDSTPSNSPPISHTKGNARRNDKPDPPTSKDKPKA